MYVATTHPISIVKDIVESFVHVILSVGCTINKRDYNLFLRQ